MKIGYIMEKAKSIAATRVEVPSVVFQKDFTTKLFQVKDPITDEILKEWSMTEREFLELDRTKRNALKLHNCETIFDEEAFLKASKEYTKKYDKYSKMAEKLYNSLISEINPLAIEIFKGVVGVIDDYEMFDSLDDGSYGISEVESVLMETIIRKIESRN